MVAQGSRERTLRDIGPTYVSQRNLVRFISE